MCQCCKKNCKENGFTQLYLSPEIDQQEKLQAEILHSFHQAISDEEFQIYLQPKVIPENGRISSAEVLVRWVRDGRLFLSPAIYIPLFEQNGFVIELDYYVYEKTFQWLRAVTGQLPDSFRLSLNVSPLHFEQPQIFIDKIQEMIQNMKSILQNLPLRSQNLLM